jgi:putative PEP-CTERM system TPR-repeat lipoprotein
LLVEEKLSMRKTTLIALASLAMCLSGCDAFMSADQRIARAEEKRDAGDERGAIIDLQNALKAAPDNLKARLLLADLSLRVGDARGAEQELERAAKSGAKPEQLAILTAETDLALEKEDELLARLDSGNVAMSQAQQLTYRGLALLAKNQMERASTAFSKAIESNATFARARIGRAQANAALGRSEDALNDLDAVLDADPKNAHALSLRGSLLERTGEYKQALEALRSARENAQGRLTPVELNTVLAGTAETQLALGDLKAAHESQSELAARAPDAPLTLYLAARLAMAEQKYSEAVSNSQKTLAAAPDFLQAKLLLGTALLAKGSANQALSELGDVVQKDPSNLQARKLLAQAYLSVQRPDLATQVLGSVQTTVQDPQLDALRGWASLQQGEQEQAVSLLERSVAGQADNVNLKLDLALAYLSSGENEKAVDLLQAIPSQSGGARRDTLLLAAVNAAKGADAGRAEAAKLVAERPKDVATLSAAAAFAFQQKDFATARAFLTRAVAQDPKSVSTLLSLGRVEAASGDFAGARTTYQQVGAIDASNAEAKLSLARLSLAQGDQAEGVRQLEDLRKVDAQSIEARLVLAVVYLQQKKPRDAEAVIAEALASANGNAKVSGAVAQLYLESGRFDEAAAKFRDAATQDPTNGSWFLGLARAQVALGNYSAARESAQKARSVSKNSTAATAFLVGLDLRDGKGDAASQKADELRKAQPKDPTAELLVGDVALNRKDYVAAAQAFQRSYELRPSAAAAIKFYDASSRGKGPQSTGLLEDWVKRQPHDMAARMFLASALIETGENARAIEEYERIALEPNASPLALNNLAWLYFLRGDTRAELTAKRAFDAASENAAIADTYGWILLKNKQVAEALPVLERAASVPQAPPEVRYHYAAALAQAGQRDRALQIVREVTAGDAAFPESADARRLLAELQG